MVSRLVHACPTAANGVSTTVSVARAIVMDNRVAAAVPDHERSLSQTQSALVGPGSALQPRVEPVRQADCPATSRHAVSSVPAGYRSARAGLPRPRAHRGLARLP